MLKMRLTGGNTLIHLHITSWVLLIILFLVSYYFYSAKDGASKVATILHMIARLMMVFVLFTGFWLLIRAFTGQSGTHMLLTLKMVGGVAVVALMEITLTKRKKGQNAMALFWSSIVVTIITIALGVILPWGPITKMFGL